LSSPQITTHGFPPLTTVTMTAASTLVAAFDRCLQPPQTKQMHHSSFSNYSATINTPLQAYFLMYQRIFWSFHKG